MAEHPVDPKIVQLISEYIPNLDGYKDLHDYDDVEQIILRTFVDKDYKIFSGPEIGSHRDRPPRDNTYSRRLDRREYPHMFIHNPLWLIIMDMLDVYDRVQLSATCKTLYNLMFYRNTEFTHIVHRKDGRGLNSICAEHNGKHWKFYCLDGVYWFSMKNRKMLLDPVSAYIRGDLYLVVESYPCNIDNRFGMLQKEIEIGRFSICTKCCRIFDYLNPYPHKHIRIYNVCDLCNPEKRSNTPEVLDIVPEIPEKVLKILYDMKFN